jgi:carboxyl-terminal processing protease
VSHRSLLGGVAFVIAGAVAGGLIVGRAASAREPARDRLGTYTQLVSLIQARAADEVDPRVAIEGSIRGMLRSLDPHSNYLDPDSFKSMLEEQHGSFSGLGIVISKPSLDKPLTVISPLEGTPAWRAGIRAGDVISQIEGVDTLDMIIDEALKRLKGPRGTRVTITVTRPGYDEALHFTITRDQITTKSIRQAFMIQPGTGYIKIENFTRTTDSELEERLQHLRSEGMERMILDLRRNPGGLLEQAVRVSDRFLNKGQMIVYTKGRIKGSDQEFRASEDNDPLDLPLVVLVDRYSASASEIVAGALQDHDRALIVGNTTWGKGLVQTVYPLSHDAALALTTARYYTPSGRLIQRDYNSLEDYLSYEEDEDELITRATEIRSTDGGRTVYGGGGIRPDVIVPLAKTSRFVDGLERGQMFFHFAVHYNTRHQPVPKDFEATEDVMRKFEAFLTSRKFAWTPENIEADRERLENEIKEAVASALWGFEAGYKIYAQADEQIKKALGLFNEARQLAALSADRESAAPR